MLRWVGPSAHLQGGLGLLRAARGTLQGVAGAQHLELLGPGPMRVGRSWTGAPTPILLRRHLHLGPSRHGDAGASQDVGLLVEGGLAVAPNA